MIVRPGGPADLGTVLGLLDEAVRWLVSRGRTGQWGDAPFSTSPARVEALQSWSDDLHIAELDGVAVGALAIGPAPEYVPPVVGPEVYVTALVGSRRGRGSGRLLLEHARAEAVARDVDRLRVDCYAGGGGALVAYYVSAGFTPTATFTVEGDWPGQVLEMPLRG
ncbi:GNAT family N-acetyltransferase [Umezawaea tangerina]|uniref:Acetyltransferase (GNAT) family protein n=1 Tax=Umezawaea tangerina TaxID=84725 RepID=A0A2T0SSI1_9PSEU|nr:GNAT family N-acetyltransferase [Umezawaea tangerina]PRY36367.1 acetyltransferase (GNAT) family protein [Umezawaea tangerina]